MNENDPWIWKQTDGNLTIFPLATNALNTTKASFRIERDTFSTISPLSPQASSYRDDYFRANKYIFDGPLLGSNEPVESWATRITNKEVLRFHRGTYGDYLATDLFSQVESTSNDSGVGVAYPLRFNAVGVSMTVISADRYLICVVQKDSNDAVTGTLGPTGSGSLEPVDALHASTLYDLLSTAATREIREESGLMLNVVGRPKLLALGAWHEKGAKPEAFFVSNSPLSARELLRLNVVEKQESTYSGRALALHVSDIRGCPSNHGPPRKKTNYQATIPLRLTADLLQKNRGNLKGCESMGHNN